MNRFLKGLAAAALSVCSLVSAGTANAAGVVFLLGTDAIAFHGDTEFINPVFDQMANFGSRRLLFVGDTTSVNYTAGNITIDFTTRAALEAGFSLAPFSGVYIDSPGTCCSDPGLPGQGLGATAAASLSSFVAGGGSIGIGDYAGADFWDPLLGFDGEVGVTTGKGGIICDDPGVSTPGGIAFGFNPSYTEGCFVHQSYDPAFFGPRGFFALQTNGDPTSPFFGDWVTIATGFVDPGNPGGGTVPEPATLVLAGLALLGAGVARRRTA